MTKKSFKIQANLAQALDETVNSANNNAGELYIQAIPIKKIKFDEHNPRDLGLPMCFNESIQDAINHLSSATISKLGLDSLAKSIKTQGVINPILVYKNNDHYQLIAGHRRTIAAMLANKLDIPAKILNNKPDELQISQLQWIENIEREDLSLWERLCNLEKIVSSFKKLHNQADVTASDLAAIINCSLQQAVNYNNIINASDKLKNLIKSGEINSIDKAATIAKSAPAAQDLLINSCLNGVSLKKLKQLASAELKSLELSEKSTSKSIKSVNLLNLDIKTARKLIELIIENTDHNLSSINNIAWENTASVSAALKAAVAILAKNK